MSEENVETVRRGYAAWNETDMEGMLAVIDPDIEYVTSGLFPGIAPVYRGHAGWKMFVREFSGPWEWVRITIEDLRDVDEQVVALLTFHARGRDGLELRRPFANVWSMRDGLAVQLRAYSAWDEALQAAGLSE